MKRRWAAVCGLEPQNSGRCAQYVPKSKITAGTRLEGLAPEESDQAYGFKPSRVGFPSADGRRPSSAA
jgi:hypothetical protein